MIRNYLTQILRQLRGNKNFTILNIIGLAIGIASFLLISRYVDHEENYDTFHEHKDQIFRIRLDRIYPEKHDKSAGLTAGAGPALFEEFPEIIDYTKLWNSYGNNVVSINENHYKEQKFYFADSSFFNIFTFPLALGDPQNALSEPHSIVLTKELANKYFGEADPIGKSLEHTGPYGTHTYMVTGVLKEHPPTHLNFDALISFKTLEKFTNGYAHNGWGWNAFLTYILIDPNTNISQTSEKFPAFIDDKYGEFMEDQNLTVRYIPQPIEDIHLHSHLRFESDTNGNAELIFLLNIIAYFILIIALVNYINLSTAKSWRRAKEIGIRKVSGAQKGHLIGYYLLESLIINIISLALAITLVQFSSSLFEDFIGQEFTKSIFQDPKFMAIIGLYIISSTVVTGAYPGWIATSFSPIKVLTGRLSYSHKGLNMRRALVVFQYVISAVLITSALIVYHQMKYMSESDNGFDQEQVLIVEAPAIANDTYTAKWKSFQSEVLNFTNVQGISSSTTIPGEEIGWVNNNVRGEGAALKDQNSLHFLGVDDSFLELYDIKLVAGRDFSRDFGNEGNAILINEYASQLLGFDSPESSLNKKVFSNNDTLHVVGVVSNYHQRGLSHDFYPMIFRYGHFRTYYSVKVSSADYQSTIDYLEAKWKDHFNDNPFTYFFLDQSFQRQYLSEQRFTVIAFLFSGLAILIACIGLFGLSSYTVLQRTKEIGIRKVLGSSIAGIIKILSSGFMKLVVIAALIGQPIAYLAIHSWLANYAFRVDMQWWYFVISILITTLIALLTVSFHTVKAANINPISSLRYE